MLRGASPSLASGPLGALWPAAPLLGALFFVRALLASACFAAHSFRCSFVQSSTRTGSALFWRSVRSDGLSCRINPAGYRPHSVENPRVINGVPLKTRGFCGTVLGVATNEGEIGQAVRRDSPWWRDPAWTTTDRDLRRAVAAGIPYDPDPLHGLQAGGLYLLYGPRRVGKTVSVKRTVARLLEAGVSPASVCRISVDGWKANRLGGLYDYVTKVAHPNPPGNGTAMRYWFIDEITATEGAWWSIVKDLRDNTAFGDDCVVLTGSSNRGLDEAIKALAGRRGRVADGDRSLLPMGFVDFCRALGLDVPAVAGGVRPDEFHGDVGRAAFAALAPFTDALVPAFVAYLECGGFPRAVADWKADGGVDPSTAQALWDVVRGEAVSALVTEQAVGDVVTGLTRRLASTVSVGAFAEQVALHSDALRGRLRALTEAFLVWRCAAADERGNPDPARQSKWYFRDPLLARLSSIVLGAPPPDITVLAEQQLGIALCAWNERARPGAVRSGDWVTHHRTDRGEVDFAGRCADTGTRATALEGKYTSGAWRGQALSLRNSALGGGVLATRDLLSMERDDPVWAVPAAFIAFALG